MNFESLPEQVQQRVIEKHIDINTDHNWWGFVYDNFKADVESFEVVVTDMHFSGFWSQGDGACFEGRIRNMRKFVDAVGEPFKAYAEMLHLEDISMSWSHRGHYCHEHCLAFQLHDDRSEIGDHEPVQELMRRVLMREDDQLLLGLEEDVIEWVKTKCRELYSQLEEEYESLTSDESIIDALEANDMLEDAVRDACEELGYEFETETQAEPAAEASD